MLHAFVGARQTTTHRNWEPSARAHQITQLDVTRGEAVFLSEHLPPLIARQPALHENRELWDRISAEVVAIRGGGQRTGQVEAGAR
jgi:hypothetical protein